MLRPLPVLALGSASVFGTLGCLGLDDGWCHGGGVADGGSGAEEQDGDASARDAKTDGGAATASPPPSCGSNQKLCQSGGALTCVSFIVEWGCASKSCLPCAFRHAGATCDQETDQCTRGACDYGFRHCEGSEESGCETNLLENFTHCGSCDHTCPENADHGEAGCANGKCVMAFCDKNWDDCDGDVESGCEENLLVSNKHCGGCRQPCTGELTCSGGVCQ